VKYREAFWSVQVLHSLPVFSVCIVPRADAGVRPWYALTDTLSEGQKAQFEEYMSAQRDVTVLTDCETFCYVFKLGAKIMMDVLTDSEMKEI